MTAVLLTPGASATRDHAQLVAIDEALSQHGIPVDRIDLPSSRPGPRVLNAIAEAAAALAERTGLPPSRVVLGGRSFGGRMCSAAVAEGVPAAGLVLVSYPLHPPGRPDQRRTEHFPKLQVPCLFVSGTRDAFATPAELEEATAAIPGPVTGPGGRSGQHAPGVSPVTEVWLEGGNHGLQGRDRAVAEAVRDWVLRLGGPPG